MPLGLVLPDTPLVFDTNILTFWMKQKPGVVAAIKEYQARLKLQPALAALTVHEALYGFENKSVKLGGLDDRTDRDRLVIEQLINSCIVLPFDKRTAESRLT